MSTQSRLGVVSSLAFLLLLAAAPAGGAVNQPFYDQIIDPLNAGDCKGIADIDGDGHVDLLMGGGATEGLNWYRWPYWTRTTIAYPQDEFTTMMAVGDVTNHGRPDIVVPDNYNLYLFKNPGPTGNPAIGSQWTRSLIGTIGSSVHDVILADYDGNGLLDVATRSGSPAQAMIFFQTSPGVWSKQVFTNAAAGYNGLGSGDINKDGNPDLVLQGLWLKNPGGTAARNPANWQQYSIGNFDTSHKVVVADINGDGVNDVVTCSAEYSAPVLWWSPDNGNPQGHWTSHVIVPWIDGTHTLQVADMNRDGKLDVIVGQMNTTAGKELDIYYNLDGTGLTWQKQLVDNVGIHNGLVGDIGGDGDMDIFGSNFTLNPPVRLYVNTTFLQGDANLDNKVDVLDLGILATNWQKTGMTWAQGDFNGDGAVNVLDLGILATNWQASSGSFGDALAAAGFDVPEPGALALLGMGAVAVLIRRGKQRNLFS